MDGGQVEFKFIGNKDQFDKIIDSLAKDVQKKADSVDKIISNLGDSFGKIGATLTTAVTLPIVGASAAIFKMGSDFEEGMSRVGAVSAATSEQMTQLHDLAIEMGKQTKFSATQAAQGIEELSKAGVSLTDILNGGLQGALSLASAGDLSLADAAEIASTALNAFKKDELSVAQAADILAGAANASATDVSELKFALSMVSAVASGVGLTFKDTSTALAIFAQNGLKGSDAGTSLKTMLLNLQPTTDAQIMQFKQLGLMTEDNTNLFYDQAGNIKNLSEISQLLKDKLSGLTSQQRSFALEQMFGTDATRAANILYQEGAKGFADMTTEMGKTTALEVSTQKMNNVKGSVEQLRGSIETLAVKFYELKEGPLKEFIDKITSLVNKMTDMDDKTLGTITKIAGFLLILGPLNLILSKTIKSIQFWGETISNVGKLIKWLTVANEGLTGAQIILNAVMSMNPIGIIIVAIVALIGFIIYLWNTNEQFRNAIIQIFTAIKDFFVNVWNSIVSFFTQTIPQMINDTIEWFKMLPTNIAIFFTNMWNSILQFGSNLLSWAQTTISNFVNSVIQFFNKLPYYVGFALGYVIGSVIKLGIDIWNWVINDLPKIIMAIITWFSELPGKIWGFLTALTDYIIQFGIFAYNWLVGKISSMIKDIIQFFSELPGKIWNSLVSTLKSILNWISNIWSAITTEIPNIINNIIDWFGKLPDRMLNIGKNIVIGLWDGIKNMTSWIIDKVKQFANGVVDGIKSALGIHSPSRVMIEVGQYVDKGFINGIMGMQSDVEKAFNNTFDLAPNVTRTANMNYKSNVIVNNNISSSFDPLGQVTNTIKTFANGSKNDYSYAGG